MNRREALRRLAALFGGVAVAPVVARVAEPEIVEAVREYTDQIAFSDGNGNWFQYVPHIHEPFPWPEPHRTITLTGRFGPPDG